MPSNLSMGVQPVVLALVISWYSRTLTPVHGSVLRVIGTDEGQCIISNLYQ